MPEWNFFAQGLDRDKNGNMRRIKTLSSNAVLLLESNLLNSLPQQKRDKYLKSIARIIYSTEFITPVGVRSRALSHKDLISFPDYHGSYTVWPKETLDAANGFRNYGLHRLAEQLENRLLNGVTISGEFYEFFYVDEDGKVAYDKEEVAQFLESKSSTTSSIPQKGQAWVISAVMNIVDKRSAKDQPNTLSSFEKKLLNEIPSIEAVLDAKDILKSEPSRMLGYTRKTRRPNSKSKK
jgi:glycogen debranching enzyme